MQVDLLTNIAPSKASGDRSGAADAVIRRLFGVGAGIRVETRWNGGAIQFCWLDVHGKNLPITKLHTILSPTGILPLSNKQMDAISPRRRRIPSGAARERSSHVLDGTNLVSTRTCTNSTHIPFFIKVLRSFFKSDRSPRSPRPPAFPASHAPRPPKSQSYLSKMRRILPRRVSDTLSVRRNLPTVRMERMSPGTSWMSDSSAGR